MNIPDLCVPAFDPSLGILIYGAGKTGRFVLEQCKLAGLPIRAILDCSPSKAFEGIEFHQFPRVPEEFRRLPVILALHGEVREAWDNLRAAGFRNIYTMSQFYLYMEHTRKRDMRCYACLGRAGEIPAHRREIEAVFNTLADERSRAIFSAQVDYRLTGNFDSLLEPDSGPLYYPDNRPFSFSSPVTFVDCGAFEGDTLQDLIPRVDLKRIAAFEPDEKTFGKLCKYLRQQDFAGEVLTFQAGVGERNDVLTFSSAQDGGATFGAEGDVMVPVFSLDSLFARFQVDFIKMDIEGSEAEALRGAAAIIRRDQPLLAISVYHNPEDLWQLPALIRELNTDYSLYLRVHHGSFHDTVCYAVPAKFRRS